MEYRKLGRTGVDVSVIGMGTEQIWHESPEYVDRVMNEAIDSGINYYDVFMPSPDIRSALGQAIKGKRDKIMLQGHIGCIASPEEEYIRTRELPACREYVHDFMNRLKTDYIDVLMLHFIDEQEDYDTVFKEGGMLDMALQFKKEGKARFIGMSGHKVSTSLQAVKSGLIDVLMFSINPAFDMLSGNTELMQLWEEDSYKKLEQQQNKANIEKKELYLECEKQGVAIVAMKPYAAGWLFNPHNPSGMVLTPHQCIHYVLSQPGVCSVLPGYKTVEHVRDAVSYLTADTASKDFSEAVSKTKWNFGGTCMYCKHCMPCPSGIDIAAVTRLADNVRQEMTDRIRDLYAGLDATGSDCIQCGVCMERCPFKVDVISNMARAATLFGK